MIEVTVIRGRISSDGVSKRTVSSTGSAPKEHRELGRLEGGVSDEFLTNTVTVAFNSAFSTKPIGWFKVYRMQPTSGGYAISDVLYKVSSLDWLDENGFEVIIDSRESISGVYLEYFYTE